MNLYLDGQHYDCHYNNYKLDIKFWLDYIYDKKGDILELCAGTGRLTKIFSKQFNHVYAVDNSLSMIDQGKINCKDCKNISWLLGDVMSLNLSEKFSNIVM